MKKPSYLAKAFNARPLGMPIPPNWFGIAAFGLLGALINPGIWLIGLGLEGMYLWALSKNQRFRNAVDAEAGVTHSTSRYEELLATLDRNAQSQQFDIERESAEIVGLLQKSAAHTSQIGDVRQMAWLHLKMLAALTEYDQYLSLVDPEGIQQQLDEAEAQQDGASSEAVAQARSKQVLLLKTRLERYQRAEQQLQLIQAQCKNVEATMKLLVDQAMTAQDAQRVGKRLEELCLERLQRHGHAGPGHEQHYIPISVYTQ